MTSSKEEKILTDNEMTSAIMSHFKKEKGIQMKKQWLDFTGDLYEVTHGEKFISKVNAWLKKHKIPMVVIDFKEIDPDINGTTWTIVNSQ